MLLLMRTCGLNRTRHDKILILQGHQCSQTGVLELVMQHTNVECLKVIRCELDGTVNAKMSRRVDSIVKLGDRVVKLLWHDNGTCIHIEAIPGKMTKLKRDK